MMQFDFGQNWADFSDRAATSERANQARHDFASLTEGIKLRRQSFLDIGFGLPSAASMAARVVGCDIKPKCGTVLHHNLPLFPDLVGLERDVEIGSILYPDIVQRLRNRVAAQGGFGSCAFVGSASSRRRHAASNQACGVINRAGRRVGYRDL